MTSFFLLTAILLPVLTGLLSMQLPRQALTRRTLLAAIGPALAFLLILWHWAAYGVADHHHPAGTDVIPWVPLLQLNLTFFADGLGLFFSLLVAGIGLLIVLYARGYFGPDEKQLYRFFPTLGFFTTAMMGIVLSDSTLLTLLFWELTSISSFLLIGWDREDKEAVRLAMQAFFTTGLGGMFLFGGILLFGLETDVWRWSELIPMASEIEHTTALNYAFLMMFVGAATKSAQWPWHYWLPGAMAAPTPVSAFLHSATMVKAGVYLTGRLYPILSGMEIWPWLILIPGAITMLLGAIIALNQHDLKRVFAYTTVSQLGLLMCAYGLGALSLPGHGGGEGHGAAGMALIDWDISQIANHAFYKAPLFIIAGALGHALGTRELPSLFGAWKKQKAMVFTMLLAGYALAGGPGTISFPAKELFFYAIYHAFEISPWFQILAVMAVLTAMCNVAIFIRLLTTLMGWRFGMRSMTEIEPEYEHEHEEGEAHEHHHLESGVWGAMIWVPALIIVSLQYIGGLLPPIWNAVFGALEVNFNYEGFAEGLPFFWQVHFNTPLVMSLVAFVGGAALGLAPILRGVIVDVHDKIYPAMYWLCVTGGGRAFATIQRGHFRQYLMMALVAFLLAFVGAVYLDPEMLQVELHSILEFWPGALIGVIVCATALMLPMVQVRVVRVVILGACGFSVVGMYLVYQAPDLALTQLMFEIISVILFVLVLRLLPEPDRKRAPNRSMRLVIGIAVGLAFGWMTLISSTSQPQREYKLGEFFARHTYEGSELTEDRGGGGENIVNVILVDFRGFDTIGEITVLAIAALGVWSLMPRFQRDRRRPITAPVTKEEGRRE